MAVITIVDQTLSGPSHSCELETKSATLTLREVIRQRVYQEIERRNDSHAEYFYGLVQPEGAELTLNGARLRPGQHIDAEAQALAALAAFARRAFIVLIDDCQVDDLDAQVTLDPAVEITFLKLTPLVGG